MNSTQHKHVLDAYIFLTLSWLGHCRVLGKYACICCFYPSSYMSTCDDADISDQVVLLVRLEEPQEMDETPKGKAISIGILLCKFSSQRSLSHFVVSSVPICE